MKLTRADYDRGVCIDIDNHNYVSKRTLLTKRGWTVTLINKLLGNYDREIENPTKHKQHTTKLFLRSRVEESENSKEFLEWKRRNGMYTLSNVETEKYIQESLPI